jgi:hypothetical protein
MLSAPTAMPISIPPAATLFATDSTASSPDEHHRLTTDTEVVGE